MYVCSCNALTDHDIRTASNAGAQRPAEVFAACNSRAQCGTCVRTMCRLIGMCLRQTPSQASMTVEGEAHVA